MACDLYADVYVMAMRNPRNQAMKEVRNYWAGSRVFQGKNKLLALALGLEESSEHNTNLHRVAHEITGTKNPMSIVIILLVYSLTCFGWYALHSVSFLFLFFLSFLSLM